VHTEEKEQDFFGESNAISDNVGDEPPRVNLDGSQVSNKNFDEKMIETVNSEVVDSTKAKQDTERDTRPKMDDIREVNEDNDNSNPKTASQKNQDKLSSKHKSESEAPAIVPLADSAPLNEPTFMKDAREEKKPPAGLGGFESKLKQNLQHPKPKQRPQTSTSSKPVKQEVYEVKKKQPIPHFGLKKKKPEAIPIADLLSKKGITAGLPKPPVEKKQQEQAPANPPSSEGQEREVSPDLKESIEFGKFLKLMHKKVKTDLKEIEDQNKWKPKKPKEITEVEVHKNQLEREDNLIKKDLLDPIRQMLDEMRKQDIEKAKRELEEFREKNAIKYPKPKQKPKPPTPEQTKPQEPIKDPIAEANAAIRAGAWKKKDKPKDAQPQAEDSKPAVEATPQGGLFEIAETDGGDQYVPISKPTKALGQPSDDLGADLDHPAAAEEHPLKNLSENLSKLDAKPSKQNQDFRISSKPLSKQKNSTKKDQRHLEDKKTIFNDYKKKEEKLKQLDEEIYIQQMMGQKIKKSKVQEVDLQIKQLEDKFHLRENREDLEKNNLMDVLSAKNKLYRHGEQPQKPPADTAKPGFQVRIGVGVQGELERDTQTADKKDKAVRAKEVARVNLTKRDLDQLGKDAFKDRLKQERELLRKRIELEQERLRELRKANYKSKNEEPLKQQEDQKLKSEAALNALREVASEEEEEQPATQPTEAEAAPKKRLKLKHALKLKDYTSKIRQANQDMIEHIKDRDLAYQELKQHYDDIISAEARREDQDNRAALQSLANRVGVLTLYTLLAKGDKDAPFIKTSQIPKHLRDCHDLSHLEKRLLKTYLCRDAGDFITFNKFESLLMGSDEGKEFLVAKSEREIENDFKLSQFLDLLEAVQRELDEFQAEVEDRMIDQYDAAKSVMRFKKRLTKNMLQMSEMMEIIFSRTDDLIEQLNGLDSREKMFRDLREVDLKNNQKLDQVAGLYQQVIRDYDENSEQMKVQDIFVLEDIEEIERREKNITNAALEATNKVLILEFHKKNTVLDAISIMGNTKKSVLLVQAWYRGWKARKLYGVKRSMRQRVIHLIRRYIARFKRRSLFKAFREVLENLVMKRLFIGFKAIALDPDALFVSRVSLTSVRRLEKHRKGNQNQNQNDDAQSERPSEANRSNKGPTEDRDAASHEDEEMFQIESQDAGDQATAPQKHQQQTCFEGRAIYYATFLQRLSRAARGKLNPEKFWLDSETATETCMLCHIKKIRVAQPDDIQPLLCLDCFEEANLNRRRVRRYRCLKVRRAEPASLADEALVQHARKVLQKIQRARKDLFEICKLWDADGSGWIELADMDYIVDRLKMLSQTEKDALTAHVSSQQRDGRLAYRAVLEELSSKN